MAGSRPKRPNPIASEKITRELLRRIGSLEPYAGADPSEVEERLRNMNYGATNSRVSKLRRGEIEEVAVETAGEPQNR